eukprot:m.125253 g.125253  ORF g.125253 m.125253 type:complete len:369 (+) comp16314_c1_seq3:1217-2323(+)
MQATLLPLGCARRLGGEVVHHARDSRHAQHAGHHLFERCNRHLDARSGRHACHKVVGQEGADDNAAVRRRAGLRLVGIQVDRHQHHRHLADADGEALLCQHGIDDSVGLAQLVQDVCGEMCRCDARDGVADRLAPRKDDAVDVVEDTRDDLGEVQHVLPHGLGRPHGERRNVAVGAAVALDADGADRQQRGKALLQVLHGAIRVVQCVQRHLHARVLVAAAGPHAHGQVSEDHVRLLVLGRRVGLLGAEDADSQAGAWKRLAVNDVRGKAELAAEHADLVLVVVLERLNHAPAPAQLADHRRVVVVRLDGLCIRAGHRRGALDEVRPQRALCEEHVVQVKAQLLQLSLGHSDKGVANDLALFLGRNNL